MDHHRRPAWNSAVHHRRFRATARELADVCRRFDVDLVGDGDIDLAARTLRSQGERDLADKLTVISAGRRAVGDDVVAGRGRWLAAIAAAPPQAPRPVIGFDDLISLQHGDLVALAAVARSAQLMFTAVDDDRLGPGRLAERLRSVFVACTEETLRGMHRSAPHLNPARTVIEGALTGSALPEDGLARYHYRDDVHAGRAIAAWLRRSGTAPGEAMIFVRRTDARALALSDALIGAGIPVRGTFHVPYLGTAAGGLLSAIGRWCERQTWGNFLRVLERLRLACGDRIEGCPAVEPPVPPRDLASAWDPLPVADAMARLATSATAAASDWQWDEADRLKPRFAATSQWLHAWLAVLSVEGPWDHRLRTVCARLPIPGAVGITQRLAELVRIAPIRRADLDDAIGAAKVPVSRGEDEDPAHCLLVHDAIRERAATRPLSIIHGLEHGQWPLERPSGSCFPPADRSAVAGTLGIDPWDERGAASGETASLLAVMARGTRRIVLGVPCGEREPSPWLATIAAQAGWDLAAERLRSADEAVPGAPLGPSDSLGEHEAALWGPVSRPRFVFAVPTRAPESLGVSASSLNDLLQDPFAFVLGRLELTSPLQDASARRDGEELHRLIERVSAEPPERWEEVLGDLLDEWVMAAVDPFARSQRARLIPTVTAALAEEAVLAAGCAIEREPVLDICIPVGSTALRLRGKADRIDRLPDGSARIVDYKFASVSRYRAVVRLGWEGQLAAYAAAAASDGTRIAGAHYRALRDGKAAGYAGPIPGPKLPKETAVVADLPARTIRLGEAIASLASGLAATDPDEGLCSQRGFAPIARLDEARLDLDGGSGDENDGDEGAMS